MHIYSRISIIRPSPLSETSIIRLGNFLLENGCVPKMRMRITAITMETGLFTFCACADNHVALLVVQAIAQYNDFLRYNAVLIATLWQLTKSSVATPNSTSWSVTFLSVTYTYIYATIFDTMLY